MIKVHTIELVSPKGETFSFEHFNTISIQESQSAPVTSCNISTAFFSEEEIKKFTIGTSLKVFQDGQKIFDGVVTSLPKSLDGVKKNYQIAASNRLFYSQRCLINDSFQDEQITTILTRLLNDHKERMGIEIGAIEPINFVVSMSFKDKHLYTILEEMAEAIDYTFYLDVDNKFYFKKNINKKNKKIIKTDMFFKGSANFTNDSSQLVNSLTVYGGRAPSRTDVVQIIKGDGLNHSFSTLYKPLASSAGRIEIYLNDIPMKTGAVGLNDDDFVDVLIDYNNKTIAFKNIEDGSERVLLDTDIVRAVYKYEQRLVMNITNKESMAEYGIYSDTLELKHITDRKILLETGNKHLTKYSRPILTGSLSSWMNDWNVNELVEVDIQSDEETFIHDTLLVTSKQTNISPMNVKISYNFEQKTQLNNVIKTLLERVRDLEASSVSEDVIKIINQQDLIPVKSTGAVWNFNQTGLVIGKMGIEDRVGGKHEFSSKLASLIDMVEQSDDLYLIDKLSFKENVFQPLGQFVIGQSKVS